MPRTRNVLFNVLFAAAIAALAALPAAARAQQPATVTGRVANEGGVPIQGVQVFIQALNIGGVTRDDGQYTFLVPGARATGQTVTIATRQVGYRAASAQITLTAGTTITQNFTLTAAPVTLSAVVVTGAGTTSTRERLGTVINSVDSTSIRRAAEPQNVVSALAGKAPNVEIRTQSGEPGASASVRIRGATSVTGTNEPLFVVDGQPIDNTAKSTNGGNQSTVTQNRAADINPNDIESVEILKGAAASAIYGARAANGVILITTKRGRPGQTRFSLQSTTSFDQVDRSFDLQRRFGLGTEGVPATCDQPNCTPASIIGADTVVSNVSWGAELAPGTQTFDHLDEIFDTGLTLDNNLSVSGGNERTTFFLSGGLTRQNGVIVGPNNEYNRTTVRLKGTHQLFSRLNVGGNFSYIDTRGRYVQKGSNISGLLLGSLRSPPEFNNKEFLNPESGLHQSYRFRNPTVASLTTGRGYDNPFFTLNNPGNTSELGRFIGNINLDYNPFEWLKVSYTLGSDYYSDSRVEALPFTSSNQPIGSVTRYDINNLEIDHNLVATANHSFGDNFQGTLTLGQNLNSRRYRDVNAIGQGLLAPEPLALQNTLSVPPPLEFKSLRHIEGYFGQATADLYNQLYLTVGLRNDGFSTFGASDRRAWYPKATAAWAFTNALGNTEQRGLLSYGKLRFGYGETGREPPVYAAINALNNTPLWFGSGYGDLVNISQSGQGGLIFGPTLGNNNLKPERNKESEYGIDLGLFDQKVDLGFTYYNRRSTDVILRVPVNQSQFGATEQLANAGTITNQGIELTLNARPVTMRNFAWDVGLQFGRNRGNVESLSGAEFITYVTEGFTGAIGSSTVGFAPGVLRGNDFVRCGLTDDTFEVESGTLGEACAGAKRGALYLGSDGQPIPDPNERVIADPNPKWTAGINTSVRLFNRLRVSGLLDIRHGGQVWNGTRGILYNFGTHKDTEFFRERTGTFGENFLTDVYPDVAGPGAGVVAFSTPTDWENWFRGEGGGFGNTSVQFIEDADFVKLREISLTYTLDQPFVRDRLGFSGVDIRLAGRNLAVWSDYKGFDPEANLGGAEFLTQGIDYFNNPLTRSYVLSVTLNR